MHGSHFCECMTKIAKNPMSKKSKSTFKNFVLKKTKTSFSAKLNFAEIEVFVFPRTLFLGYFLIFLTLPIFFNEYEFWSNFYL